MAPTTRKCEDGRHTGSWDDDFDEWCDLVGAAVEYALVLRLTREFFRG